jgi:phage minor structural protein
MQQSGIIDLWHDERLDQSETLTFVIPTTHPKAYLVVEDAEVQWRDRRFFIRESIVDRAGARTTLTVQCDALWYRLADTTKVGSFILTGQTTAQGLATILESTGWATGETTSSSPTTFSMEAEDLTVLALIREWAKITGTDVVWDTAGRSVALVADRGIDRGIAFRYGRNLTRIRRRSIPPEATRMFPYGADGLSIAGINGGLAYIEDFTFYTDQGLTIDEARARYTRDRVWADSSFVTDTALLAAAQARLARQAQPTVSYELDVVDLSQLAGQPSEDLNIGDNVRVADEPLGLDVRTTVVRRVRYPLQPWRNQIELAYLPSDIPDGATSSRPSASAQWLMFKSDNAGAYQLRNDGTYILNRIGLRFREGGEAVFGHDITFTGVGDGELTVQLYDAQTDTDLHPPRIVPYLDGERLHVVSTWALNEQVGQLDIRVRCSTTATGGPDPADGIDVADASSRLWVLAYGAVRETPTLPNVQRFTGNSGSQRGTGTVETFTVPDNVTEIEIVVAGGTGANSNGSANAPGGIVSGKLTVTPGQQFEVRAAGGGGTGIAAGGWPNGGTGSSPDLSTVSGGGGGSSDIRPVGGSFTDAYIVAAGGGGSGHALSIAPADQQGGAGGFFEGQGGYRNGISPDPDNKAGGGATQFAGGTGGETAAFGPPPFPQTGENGSFGQGGNAGDTTSSFGRPGGGGGGGWYGGGGAGAGVGSGLLTGGGGGGSGWIDPDFPLFDIQIDDGGNTGDSAGYVEFRWNTPI